MGSAEKKVILNLINELEFFYQYATPTELKILLPSLIALMRIYLMTGEISDGERKLIEGYIEFHDAHPPAEMPENNPIELPTRLYRGLKPKAQSSDKSAHMIDENKPL